MRKTRFHEINLEHGAQMREMFGFYLPWEYSTGHGGEHTGTRERASLCDLDYMGEFSIEGPGALSFLQKLLTVDLSKQTIGMIKYTTMCNEQGNMIDDGTIWRMGEDRFMLITGDEGDFEWLQHNARGFDVTVNNISEQIATLALQGPLSRAILGKLTSADLDAIKYYHFIQAKVDGVDCLLDRMGYTGEFGYELHFDPRHARQLWTALMKAGAPYGIVPCGQAALESLRQEAGYLLVGNDHDKNTNPFEAGIGWTVKFGKGDFNGKQALMDIVTRGLRRKLVWFKLPGGEVAAKGYAIYSGPEKIGEVTSGSYSPTTKAGTAMGYVLPQFAIGGAEFQIMIDGERRQAALSIMPLYDPGDLKTKSRV